MKKDLRTEFLEKRLAIKNQQVYLDEIGKHLRQRNILMSDYSIGAYIPIKGELDILKILVDKFKLSLPTIDSDTDNMVFRRWQQGDKLEKNRFNIDQPLKEATEIVPEIVFVPLLAFDKKGHRIGYGGGYYDRYMQKVRAEQVTPSLFIGIGYDFQEIDKLPSEEHDQTLDMIVTERKIIINKTLNNE